MTATGITRRTMDPAKIANAVKRLERNLPIRCNQTRLPEPLRRLHRRILRYYLETGHAPAAGDFADVDDLQAGIEQLAAEHIIVLDAAGAIVGAYPFVDAAREFRVITNYGPVNAMCAFDALAISSMFDLPSLIEARCRVSGEVIVIEQEGDDIRVAEPGAPVCAAIDWRAAAGASNCSATLCAEMIFIAGDARAARWRDADPDKRELFELREAHAVIAAVFLPLVQ